VTLAPTEPARKVGVFNYLAASVPSSLYRNGSVLTRRDKNGNDAGTQGIEVARQEVPVLDARAIEQSARRTLKTHGFELRSQPLMRDDLDFLQHEQVVRSYYGDCEHLVREATGASHVFAFDHNIRSAAGKSSRRRIEGGQQVQGPGHFVHGDYTLASAPQRLRELGAPPTGNDTLRSVLGEEQPLIEPDRVDRSLGEGGHFAIINVWRNIGDEPVASHPLALCDAQTVRPEDLVVFEIHYADRIGENYFARHASRHRWYWYPSLTRDEVVLIKQWDSDGALAQSGGDRADADDGTAPATFSFHSAFVDPATPEDASDRWSIEVRCAVVYD